MKLPIRKGEDLHRIIEAAELLDGLSRSHTSFVRRLQEQLDKKGGPFALWLAIRDLIELGLAFKDVPLSVEVVEKEEPPRAIP